MTSTEYSRRRREALKAQGLCTICGIRPSSGRGGSCEYCRSILALKSRINRDVMKAHGLCQSCGKRDALPGQYRCAECVEKNKVYQRAYYRRRAVSIEAAP